MRRFVGITMVLTVGLAAALAVASIRAIGTHGDVVPATSPTVSSEPSPTGVQVHEAVIAGIPGTVCDPSSVEADFGLGGAATDTAYVYGVPTAAGGCVQSGPRTAWIGMAPDTERNSASEVSITSDPIDCGDTGCRVLAAPDIDGDGIAELAVVTQEGVGSMFGSMSLGLYTPACPAPTACPARNRSVIAQYEFRKEGSAEKPATVEWVEGAEPDAGATCVTGANGGRLLRLWAARYIGSGALYDHFRLHKETYSVHGTLLELKRTDEQVVDQRKLPSSADFCDASIVD